MVSPILNTILKEFNMELVIGLIVLAGIGILIWIKYNKNKAKEINDVPYKIESSPVEVVEVPKSLIVLETDEVILSEKKGKMAKPNLTKVEGGPNKRHKGKPKAPVTQPKPTKPKGSPEAQVKKSTKPRAPKKP
jgi:hypothetical protein